MAGPGEFGLIVSDDDVNKIISSQGTPPSIRSALEKGHALRRVKRDAIWSTLRFAANIAAAGNVQLLPNTYRAFVATVGQNAQGFVPAMTFADTNLSQSGRSPFSGLFVARRLNVYLWSTQGGAPNNQADEAVENIVFHSYLQVTKGTSFNWTIGPVSKCVNYRGNKIYNMQTDGVGFGIGDGYDLGIPFVIEPEESLGCLLVTPNPADHGLTLPTNYVVDVKIEFDGDAVELVSQ